MVEVMKLTYFCP